MPQKPLVLVAAPEALLSLNVPDIACLLSRQGRHLGLLEVVCPLSI